MAASVESKSLKFRGMDVNESHENEIKIMSKNFNLDKNFFIKNKNKEYFVVKKNITENERAFVNSGYVVNDYIRKYSVIPEADGFIGVLDSDGNGLNGVEYIFNEKLRGRVFQKRVMRDRVGRVIKVESNSESIGPADVFLTIDLKCLVSNYAAALKLSNKNRLLSITVDAKNNDILSIINLHANQDEIFSMAFEPKNLIYPFVVAAAIENNAYSLSDLGQVDGKINSFNVKAIDLWNFFEKIKISSPISVGFKNERHDFLPKYSAWTINDTAKIINGEKYLITLPQLVSAYSVLVNDGGYSDISIEKNQDKLHKFVMGQDLAEILIRKFTKNANIIKYISTIYKSVKLKNGNILEEKNAIMIGFDVEEKVVTGLMIDGGHLSDEEILLLAENYIKSSMKDCK